MKFRLVFLLAVAACISGFTEQDVEEAKGALLACLQDEVKSKIVLRMDSDDFALSVQGACFRQADRFVNSFVDYMSERFPTIDPADHIAKAREAIDGWRAEAAKSYADNQRSSGKR